MDKACDIIYVGFCINDFVNFKAFIDERTNIQLDCVYLLDSENDIYTNPKKMDYIKPLTNNLIFVDKDGKYLTVPTSENEAPDKISKIVIYSLPTDNKPILTKIHYTDKTKFIFFLDQCLPETYNALIEKFSKYHITVISKLDPILILKDLIMNETETMTDVIKLVECYGKFTVAKLGANNYLKWERAFEEKEIISQDVPNVDTSTPNLNLDQAFFNFA